MGLGAVSREDAKEGYWDEQWAPAARPVVGEKPGRLRSHLGPAPSEEQDFGQGT